MPDDIAEVHLEKDGTVARIVLDRPQSLNSLTTAMVTVIAAALDAWRKEPLRAVTIESSSKRAFCAGGDIRQIRANTLNGDHRASEQFFAAEYAVNSRLGNYPIPIVALIDGVCMGGGMGLSMHGPYRVATPGASFAMPEVKIGFFPDVGASHFLPRLPGATGRFLALTGTTINASDAVELGIATHICFTDPLDRIPTLLAHSNDPVGRVLQGICSGKEGPRIAPAPSLRERRSDIDWAFGPAEIATVLARLTTLVEGEVGRGQWATQVLSEIRAASPQSIHLTDDLLAWGGGWSLERCLATELAMARRVIQTPDFLEGVRAALVDKDRKPAWSSPKEFPLSEVGPVAAADNPSHQPP